ncbi:unnamed protein product [Ilex paraguariensis]|uniref:LysM domain-containing protein n=1 Tax=Ilex paraguariensis TaxID=185542 RepID=A0ABC8RC32_9AQUA
MTTSIASQYHHLLLALLITIFTTVFPLNIGVKSSLMYPLSCSDPIQTCYSYLYHISKGLQLEEIASFYSVNISKIEPITHGIKQDYLVSVPCTCKEVNGTSMYFYDTPYTVQAGNTFINISSEFYSGQVWQVTGEDKQFVAGSMVTMHLLCGCVERESQVIVTYTVQEDDTVQDIAGLLSAEVNEIENMNARLTRNPNYIDIGWVLFVPMEKRGLQAPKQRK